MGSGVVTRVGVGFVAGGVVEDDRVEGETDAVSDFETVRWPILDVEVVDRRTTEGFGDNEEMIGS